MQIDLFEFVVGLAGLVSLGFNFFQLYRERVLRGTASEERKLHVSTLTAIGKGLTEARTALAELHHKGAPSDALEATAARSLDAQRVQIAELLSNYYGSTTQAPAGRLADCRGDDPITTGLRLNRWLREQGLQDARPDSICSDSCNSAFWIKLRCFPVTATACPAKLTSATLPTSSA